MQPLWILGDVKAYKKETIEYKAYKTNIIKIIHNIQHILPNRHRFNIDCCFSDYRDNLQNMPAVLVLLLILCWKWYKIKTFHDLWIPSSPFPILIFLFRLCSFTGTELLHAITTQIYYEELLKRKQFGSKVLGPEWQKGCSSFTIREMEAWLLGVCKPIKFATETHFNNKRDKALGHLGLQLKPRRSYYYYI